MKKYPSSLVIALLSILTMAGMVGPGAFRWVLFAIAAVVAVVLARRSLAAGSGS